MMKGIVNKELGIRSLKLALPVVLLYSLFIILYSTHVQAQSIDLLWQGETYTPPFYKGRSLWSNQSRINFVAIPQGLGNPASLNYKWTKNDTVLGNLSGVGKNTLSFFDTILSRPQTIRIEIVSGEDEVLASASTVVTPISPMPAVYESNPLYGFMFHDETSGAYQLQKREITFAAFPFFFSVLNRADSGLSYEWRTNVGEAETRNSVTYRTPENAAGSSPVSVRVFNKGRIMQDAKRSFLVEFSNP